MKKKKIQVKKNGKWQIHDQTTEINSKETVTERDGEGEEGVVKITNK